MAKISNVGEAERRIADSTYPNWSWRAIVLYSKILQELTAMEEPVEFGDQALDIGSKDARYVPVIRELGVAAVKAIDPSLTLKKGIEAGIVTVDETFFGTIQEYILQKNEPASSAFALNIYPALPNDESFVNAVMQSVKPGGIIVSSCAEWDTYYRWLVSICGEGRVVGFNPQETSRVLAANRFGRFRPRRKGHNEYLHIGRRAMVGV